MGKGKVQENNNEIGIYFFSVIMQFLKDFFNSEGTLTRIQFFYRCLFLFIAYWALRFLPGAIIISKLYVEDKITNS